MTRVKRRVFGEDRMAYLLVAVGAVMFGLGVYAAVTGSQIVQVEAGWTSVIAGTMSMVGGVLTMALGLVLRALLQLKASLGAAALGPLTAPASQAFGHEPPLDIEPETARASMPLDPISHDATFPEPALTAADFADADPIEPPPLPPAHKPTIPPLPKSSPLPGLFRRKAPRPVAAEEITAPVGLEPTFETSPVAPTDPEPFVEEQPLPPAHEAPTIPPHEAIAHPHPADDYEIDTASTSRRDLPPSLAPVPVVPIDEPHDPDWLDRAFAEFDDAMPSRHEPTDPHETAPTEIPPLETTPLGPEPAHASEPPHAVPEPPPPAHAPTLPRAPTLPPQTSAVIGRYEADGTSYVMYADGSIEAHSEAGTYRFASMTELKAFIEA